MVETKYIETEIVEKIKSTAVLKDVIENFVSLSAKNEGQCYHCSSDHFSYSKGKNIYKCFGCDKGGNSAVKFLMDIVGKTYQEALLYLAGMYNIDINTPSDKTKKKRGNRTISFRDQQLKESGISKKDHLYNLPNPTEKAQYELERFQAATLDQYGKVVPGDDMLLHYIDLNWHPIKFKPKSGKETPLIRVRWANPALHLSKEGKPMKYKSPYGSGSQLWLPTTLIKAVENEQIIETLYITEGEKKATKMCKHGMWTVGIMGINNFNANGEMPRQFRTIIKKCGVANVVFIMDADWQDLKLSPSMPVDQRPKSFFAALKKFRDYFYAYSNEGFELGIYFAYGIDMALKGMDDLLVRGLKNKEQELYEDFEKARKDRKGEGQHVQVHNVTTISEYKLMEFWHLQNDQAFLQAHKEELKPLKEFKLKNITRRYDKDSDQFKLAQDILPFEQFWTIKERESKSGNTYKQIEFDYRKIRFFLKNRGFGINKKPGGDHRYIWCNNQIVEEVTHKDIQRYTVNITEQLELHDVTNMLLRGNTQYLGPDKLSMMFERNPPFIEPAKDHQFLFFKNCYWKVTAEGVEQRPLKDLPEYIWKDQIIDFEPTYLADPIIQVNRKEKQWEIKQGAKFQACEMALFYLRTSYFHFRKYQELVTDEKGISSWQDKPEDKIERATADDVQTMQDNFVAKMIAAGKIMHRYRDYANMRAIIGMDGQESEVGKSQGGSGKSAWGKAFKYLMPIEIIDGKKKNLEDDNHLYEKVTDKTGLIMIDDVRVNFSLEWLFAQITTSITVNPKGTTRYDLPPPAFYIPTNHALNGEGTSFERRQYLISFSDYYNGDRSIADDFGHQMYYEWENEQWNLFYNFKANCLQTYLKYGLKYTIPKKSLLRRKLRQFIGEDLIEWASNVFHKEEGIFRNRKVEKNFLMEHFLNANPSSRKYINATRFKAKMQKYAEYAGMDWNITSRDTEEQRIRSNGKEFFLISDEDFDANNNVPILNETDINKKLNYFD